MIASATAAAAECASGEPTALQWWDHQRRWLEDTSRLRVCCKARQIGMSTVLATEALHAAVYGETTVIVSASQRQASELLRKATQLLPLVSVAADGAVRVDKQSAEAIELSTGGRVISLPAMAATVQGYTGHVVIDEAAWIPDVDALWMAVVPTISTRGGYRLSVVSTPGPRAGMFHRLWHSGDAAWSRHCVTIYDAKRGERRMTSKPFAPPSVISTGGSLGTGQGSFDLDDASAWPTKGFWIKNTTASAGAGDCRYVNYRSGNTLYCFGVEWATLGFDAGSTQINPGDAITDPVSGATAIVDQVEVTSGGWGTNDAAGTLLLKKVVGIFGDNNAIQVSAATVATSDGSSVLGLRGHTAVNWNAADAFDFGVWFSPTTPVDTSGPPDQTISYFAGVGDYQITRQQTGDEYVAVAAVTLTDQGPVAELDMPWSTVAPNSPADQYAYRNSKIP